MGKVNISTLDSALMQSIERLNKLDFSNKEKAKMEIARSNAISQAGKTLIQSIGMQVMARNVLNRSKNEFREMIEYNE